MNHSAFSLTGKTILITGASSGIGRSCAIECSRMGARVFLLGRNADRLRVTLDELDDHGKEHKMYIVDFSNCKNIDDFIGDLLNDHIKIDGLVHCAGVSSTTPLRVFNPEKLAEMVHLNVTSAIHLTKGVTQKRLTPDAGQSIVFLSSVMGVVGEVAKTMYCITKGAIIAATHSLALELAPKKTRVNSVSPGVVQTPMSHAATYSRNEESLSEVLKLHPLGIGQPEDVAFACIYLLSNASKWVTGTNLIIDGGYTAR